MSERDGHAVLDMAEIASCTAELVALVSRHLPQRIYKKEPRSRIIAVAAIVRMCETAEAIMSQIPARRDVEASVLLRSLYEQMVTFMWFAADPEPRLARWQGEAWNEQAKLHNVVSTYGFGFLSPEDLERQRTAEGMPPIILRAEDVDATLARDGTHDVKHPLSLRGQYAQIYRITSRATHASIISLDTQYVREGKRGVAIVDRPGPDKRQDFVYGTVPPMLTQALIVAADVFFPWLDENEVIAINQQSVAAWERTGNSPAM